MYYTIKETRAALKAGEVTSEKLVRDAIDTFNKDKSAPIPLNAFIEMYDDAADFAAAADKEIAAARSAGSLDKLFEEKPLLGIPFALKDNMNSKGHRLTCASKILEGYEDKLHMVARFEEIRSRTNEIKQILIQQEESDFEEKDKIISLTDSIMEQLIR